MQSMSFYLEFIRQVLIISWIISQFQSYDFFELKTQDYCIKDLYFVSQISFIIILIQFLFAFLTL
jgi:hypothetical protein